MNDKFSNNKDNDDDRQGETAATELVLLFQHLASNVSNVLAKCI